MNKTHNYYG